jgi:hypothetical protein
MIYENENPVEIVFAETDVAKIQVERDELRRLCQDLLKAVRNKGRVPEYHDKVTKKHRAEWPALWRAIDKIEAQISKGA